MRISEAMALGSHVIKPRAGVHLDITQSYGCAWGMAYTAAPMRYAELLQQASHTPVSLPCECRRAEFVVGGGMQLLPTSVMDNLAAVSVHLFNYHVATKQDWTMERLIDWVRANEPADPEAVEEKEECTPELVAHS